MYVVNRDYFIGNFGDVRRAAAGARMFEQVVTTGSLVLRTIGGDRAGELSAGRFLDSPCVTPEEILTTAARRTAKACVGRRIVAAHDTTEVNFSGRDFKREGLGPAGDGKALGFFCHGMIAVDADDEALLGVVHAKIWTRSGKTLPKRRTRKIEEKESIRWIEATEAANDLLSSAAQVIVVGDREFDIYSQFARRPEGVELIIRAAQNRKLADDERLFDAPTDWRAFGTMDIFVPPKRPGERGRIAHVTVKAGRVCICKPRNGASPADPETVMLTYVEVNEPHPPSKKERVTWRLLTTLPVVGEIDEFAAAQDVVRLYRLRWRIEQVFRAMKSDGLRIEETQVREAHRLFNLTAIALIGGARTIQLVDARDGSVRPATDVADQNTIAAAKAIGPTLEGKTERQKNPHPKGSLAFAAWVIARLGGWTGYYGKPGPMVMRRGLDDFRRIKYGTTLELQNV